MGRPPPKLHNFYGHGGWTPAKKKILDAVVLPEKSRCCECHKIKATSIAFSEKQQNDLRNGIANGQVPANSNQEWITCRDCVGKPLSEMLCNDCDTFKGLDDFAKTQRRDPDNARCKTCAAFVVNKAPRQAPPPNDDEGAREAENLDDSDDDSDDDSVSNAYGSTLGDTQDLESDAGVRLPHDEWEEDLHSLNISRGPTTASKTPTSVSVAGSRTASRNIQGWQQMSSTSGKENAAPATARSMQVNVPTKQFTAYDAQGKAHAKSIAPSARSTDDYDDDDSDATTPPAGTVAKKKGSKFATAEKVYRPGIVPQTYAGRNVKYDSDDDDDDDGGYFEI